MNTDRNWWQKVTLEEVLSNKDLFRKFAYRDCSYFKKRFPDWIKNVIELVNWNKSDSTTELVWCYINKLTEYPKCPVCGNNITKFYRFCKGYVDHCSKKCGFKTRTNSFWNTCLEKYGVKSHMKVEHLKVKYKSALKEKYDVENVFQLKSVKEKICKTTLKKYDVKHISLTKEFQIKRKNTIFKKYGTTYPPYTLESNYKRKLTCLEKYGVEHPMHVAEIAEKNFIKNKKPPKWHTYTLPSGKNIRIQGYEHWALDILLQTYKENDIVTRKTDIEKYIGKIWYLHNGVMRRYYPDFYIISKRLIIEVKSEWLATQDIEKIKLKKEAASSNFQFEFMIFNKKGVLLQIQNS